jgi:hypothetical protein
LGRFWVICHLESEGEDEVQARSPRVLEASIQSNDGLEGGWTLVCRQRPSPTLPTMVTDHEPRSADLVRARVRTAYEHVGVSQDERQMSTAISMTP